MFGLYKLLGDSKVQDLRVESRKKYFIFIFILHAKEYIFEA
jgi:hypothetical protein